MNFIQRLLLTCSPLPIFGFVYCLQFYRRKGIFSSTFTLTPVSRHFIRKQFSSLKTDENTGLDGISLRFLKGSVKILVDPVSHIVNLSFTSRAMCGQRHPLPCFV